MFGFKALLASAAASTLVSFTMSTPLNSTSIEAEKTISYWYPDEMEIAKKELCKQFDEDYTSAPDLLERYSAYCKINDSEKRSIHRNEQKFEARYCRCRSIARFFHHLYRPCQL